MAHTVEVTSTSRGWWRWDCTCGAFNLEFDKKAKAESNAAAHTKSHGEE